MSSLAEMFREAHRDTRVSLRRESASPMTYRECFAWFLKLAWAKAKKAMFEVRAKAVAPKLFAELTDLQRGFRFTEMSDNRFYSSGRESAMRSRIAALEAALAVAVSQPQPHA
ncbi:hypothetical protein E2A64_03000 [Pseudohoeflea suaedae]|uniref:Uncharacterized protein n=1 Tax=Pseudohoeflea suaedae TaxID=877384 RepID=A0A4R5PNC9_9HYPH|nr:hypothetical protein [Pseudohoeflea suaedae]TDH38111.1 hypothetical protein E2A64_03000 [Pseudohoeflea suaedae]